jgi:hypothetical protein
VVRSASAFALVTGDVSRAALLYTDDFQLIHPLGRVLSKKQYLERIGSGQLLAWCLMPSSLDLFIPRPDVRERFHTTINAPAPLVMDVATNFDMQSLPLVHAIFWLREKLMRATPSMPRKVRGLLAETQGMGWGLLVEQPGRLIVCGAACQPWMASPGFTPIPAERFAAYAGPNQVKIAWTLEADPLGPATTRFTHETRAVATDAQARLRFRRYWRWARFGIVAIRLLLLPAVRRAAERRWSAVGRADRD